MLRNIILYFVFLFLLPSSLLCYQWIDITNRKIKDNITGSIIYSIKYYGDEIFVNGNNSLYKTDKKNINWEFLNEVEEVFSFSFLDKKMIVLNYYAGAYKLLISDSTFNNWKLFADIPYTHLWNDFIISNENLIYIISLFYQQFKTTDKGLTWVNILPESFRYVVTNPVNGYIYAYNSFSKIVSYDDGISWSEFDTDLPFSTISFGLAQFNEQGDMFIGINRDQLTSRIYKSSNNGKNFKLVYYKETQNSYYKNKMFFKDNWGFASYSPGLIMSSDSGNTWQKIETPVHSPDWVRGITMDDENNLYIASDSGYIYTTKLEPISVEEGINTNNAFVTIYPNPSDRTIHIILKSTSIGMQNIIIYNSLGMEVKRLLLSGDLANKDINIDISDLPSGIYFATLRAGGQIHTEQLVVLR